MRRHSQIFTKQESQSSVRPGAAASPKLFSGGQGAT